MNDKNSEKNPFAKVNMWMVGAVGFLVGIPALINGVYDIYRTALNVPVSNTEKVNAQLFEEHFKEKPLIESPIPIKHKNGTIDAILEVYEVGDIYLQYGNKGQWFPSPFRFNERETSAFSIVSVAVAENINGLAPTIKSEIRSYRLTESYEGRFLKREKDYGNGSTDVWTIEPNTGEVVHHERVKSLPEGSDNSVPGDIPVVKFPEIDLEKIRK